MSYLSFQSFLERKQISLYHGTTTGEDESNLNSFLQKGIKPHSSTGWGQGSGYYSYSGDPSGDGLDGAKRAYDHAKALITPDAARTAISHSGRPMVVSHKAMLNPKDYELDKELESKDLQRFMLSKVGVINRFLKAKSGFEVMPNSEQGGSFANPFKIYEIFKYKTKNGESLIGFWFKDPRTLDISKVQANDSDTNIIIKPNNLNDASDLNIIMKSLFDNIPELSLDYKRYVRSIMKRTAEGRAKPRAWKYVGDQQLSPDAIKVQDTGGSWRDKSPN